MTRSVEEAGRRYLRLFPEWMRDLRGEEALGLVLDQLPDGAERLPLRSKADLVRAGLHARRRGTPPPWVLSTVSRAPGTWPGRGSAVPVAWRPWLVTRLRHRRFVWECAFMPDISALPTMILLALFWSADWGVAAFGIMALVLIAFWAVRGACFLLFRQTIWRTRLTQANGLDLDGVPLPPSQVTVGWNKAAMRNTWVLPFAVAATGVAAVGAPLGWAVLASGSASPPVVHAAGSSVFLVAVATLAAAGWAWNLTRRVDAAAAPLGARPCTDRGRNLAVTLLHGGVAGGVVAALVVVPGVGAGLHGSFALAAPLAAAAATLVIAGAQRSCGRPLGAWDLFPAARPQPVVHRVEDLPPPPRTPDTPAFG